MPERNNENLNHFFFIKNASFKIMSLCHIFAVKSNDHQYFMYENCIIVCDALRLKHFYPCTIRSIIMFKETIMYNMLHLLD